MLKKVFRIGKKAIFSALILYGYNVIAEPLKIIVPINFVTVGSMTALGFPALFAFIAIYYLVY